VFFALEIENANESDHPGNIFVSAIWQQIAEHFRDYDDRLIFATLNEPRHYGGEREWSGATQTVRDNVNHLNQVAVDVIRATGGNNRYRILQAPTVAAGATHDAMRDFIVPDDPINTVNKIAWGIHTYSPFDWAHDGNGDYQGAHLIIQDLNNVNTHAQRLGIPVIMGEWGSILTSRGGSGQSIRNRHRPQHAEDFSRAAQDLGMVVVWWDNHSFTGSEQTFGLIPRMYPHKISDVNQEIINRIMYAHGKHEYIVAFPEQEDEDNTPVETTPLEIEIEIYENENNEVIPPADENNNGIDAWVWILIIGIVVAVPVLIFALKKKK
jgi:aryl-phospho-beta-D-glucosidase BglC (GH1 family)